MKSADWIPIRIARSKRCTLCGLFQSLVRPFVITPQHLYHLVESAISRALMFPRSPHIDAGTVATRDRQYSPRTRTAQTTRAILFARATDTRRAGRRLRRLSAHSARGVVRLRAKRMTAVAPTTRSRRRYLSPILEMWPRRSLPPLEFCLGTRPSHAANCRPDLNCKGSVTVPSG